MGREIRKVPLNWEHPKDEKGEYIPMLDKTFEDAMSDYNRDKGEWEARVRSEPDFTQEMEKIDCTTYEDYETKPEPEWYRPAFEATAKMGFCVYEDVSEGTPVSPVFEDESQLLAWLIEQGHQPHAAERFIRAGWAPSMMMVASQNGVEFKMNIDVYEDEN